MTPPLLETRALHRVFSSPAGPIPILRDLNLKIDPGERLLLLGPSGGGKTTLLHLLALLDRPDAGEIHWRGENMNHWDDVLRSRHRALNIGMVFQQFHTLPHRSVRDNLRLRLRYHPRPDAANPEREDQLLAEIGLLDRANHPARLLSGGELQRLCIARALLLKPAFLLADEPTGNLDDTNAAIVRELFSRIAGPDTAVIIATHDPRWLGFTQNVLHIGNNTTTPPPVPAPQPPPNASRSVPFPRASLRTLTLFMTCFVTALLLGAALHIFRGASDETRALLRAWPPHTSTLHFTEPPHPSDLQRILALLPPASTFGHRIENRVAHIEGTLPPFFFQGEGSPIPPDLLAQGQRVALLSQSYATRQSLYPGDTLEYGGQLFTIYGIGTFPLDADILLPARATDAPSPDTWLVQSPAHAIQNILHAPEASHLQISLTDHDQRRGEISQSFKRLRLGIQALGAVVALLTALVIHSLLTADVRERRAEIGLRRSLGATTRDIRFLFISEAAKFTIPASTLGLLPWLYFLPLSTLLPALALLSLWLLATTILPASHAAHLPPSDSLRGA